MLRNRPSQNLMVPVKYPSKDDLDGYAEICSDTDNLVISGALLILFPPSPPSGWLCPTADDVKFRPTKLIELGFKLDDKSIVDALQIFENKLDIYGDIFWNNLRVLSQLDRNKFNITIKLEVCSDAEKSRFITQVIADEGVDFLGSFAEAMICVEFIIAFMLVV
ncbi:17097_t:CDS:2 [Funneliformis caledonium]|uniref:17097_t:CDS:1 n=1 Tax=Funneliformis caledonium TaxID=1117310 RepID=A0A9N9DHF2_9GLOM|nr:17097_t:CDS:2 [Funneliformis caledonium]